MLLQTDGLVLIIDGGRGFLDDGVLDEPNADNSFFPFVQFCVRMKKEKKKGEKKRKKKE